MSANGPSLLRVASKTCPPASTRLLTEPGRSACTSILAVSAGAFSNGVPAKIPGPNQAPSFGSGQMNPITAGGFPGSGW